jgi:hypothetical protein
MNLGPNARAIIRLIEKQLSARIEHPRRLTAGMDDATELVHQPRRFERDLPVVRVNVEHPALRPRGGRLLGLVHRRRNAVRPQNTRQREPAEPGADNCDQRQYSPLITKNVPRMVPASFDF